MARLAVTPKLYYQLPLYVAPGFEYHPTEGSASKYLQFRQVKSLTVFRYQSGEVGIELQGYRLKVNGESAKQSSRHYMLEKGMSNVPRWMQLLIDDGKARLSMPAVGEV